MFYIVQCKEILFHRKFHNLYFHLWMMAFLVWLVHKMGNSILYTVVDIVLHKMFGN